MKPVLSTQPGRLEDERTHPGLPFGVGREAVAVDVLAVPEDVDPGTIRQVADVLFDPLVNHETDRPRYPSP